MSLFQPPLFEPSTRVKITLAEDHELVRLSRLINWTALITIAASWRSAKVKKECGPEPRYRALLGALVLMALRKMTYRDAEDQIAHYAPARYLCDLMDCDWTPDHVTIFDFATMLGPEGVETINIQVLKTAEKCGVLDASVMMSDTTAQEAMVPYPTEVGLMGRFMRLASRAVSRLGGKFSQIKARVKAATSKVKGLVRAEHLFAKGKEQKGKIGRKIYHTVQAVQTELAAILASGGELRSRAGTDLTKLCDTMSELLPQIWHFLTTGFVAAGKIIHLQMPDLYAIVRGKAGKRVEFGLKWGISRIGCGFLQGFLMNNGRHGADQQFCLESIKIHKAVFGEAPEIFGFDRGGYSRKNLREASRLGVKEVGIAPTGKAKWAVDEAMTERIRRERAHVEGAIGTIKSHRYGFNKPAARSKAAMVRCGHRAILGFNLRKLVTEYAATGAAPGAAAVPG